MGASERTKREIKRKNKAKIKEKIYILLLVIYKYYFLIIKKKLGHKIDQSPYQGLILMYS